MINRRALLLGACSLELGACATPPQTPEQWRQLPTEAYSRKQDDLFFATRQLGWYGNGAGKLYRTRNGGDAWEKVWDHPGTYIRALGFVDERNGFLGNVGAGYHPSATDPTPLYSTQDAGLSWQPTSSADPSEVKGICAIDILRGAGAGGAPLIHAAGRVGGPAMMLRSVDGGATWRTIDLREHAGMILDVKFFDANVGFLCAASHTVVEQSSAAILRTTDGGATWRQVYRSNRASEICWKMSFPSARVGYATIQSNNPNALQRFIVKSTDYGRTWRELALTEGANVTEFGIGFLDERCGWVGTSTSGFATRDGGRSWRPAAIGQSVNKIRIVRDAAGFSAFAIGIGITKLDGDL